jgi:hypothetical protein
VLGKYVNLKKSISDMYAGLKVYDTIMTIHSRIQSIKMLIIYRFFLCGLYVEIKSLILKY